MNVEVKLSVGGQGLYDVTHRVVEAVLQTGVDEGLVTVFLRRRVRILLNQ